MGRIFSLRRTKTLFSEPAQLPYWNSCHEASPRLPVPSKFSLASMDSDELVERPIELKYCDVCFYSLQNAIYLPDTLHASLLVYLPTNH